MGLDIAIGIDKNINTLSDKELEKYYQKHPDEMITEKLGSSSSIYDTLGTIEYHLSKDDLKINYPVFSKIDNQVGFCGWKYDELINLKHEINDIIDKFSKIDYRKQISVTVNENKAILNIYTEEEVQQITKSYCIAYPDKKLKSLYDLNHWFLDTLIKFIDIAIKKERSIYVY